ncbi:MAG: sugar phosphate isomerase/epimerase, partial [Clostridia bacterium]|nr:sugar phosphate isomerase/epimerase [Clostridia bacterium]
GHGNRSCDDQIPSIMRLGNRIKALHINDNLGDTDLHTMPFLGSVPWENVMHALYVSGCDADLIYEIRINSCMPDPLMDLSARYCREVGEYLLTLYR